MGLVLKRKEGQFVQVLQRLASDASFREECTADPTQIHDKYALTLEELEALRTIAIASGVDVKEVDRLRTSTIALRQDIADILNEQGKKRASDYYRFIRKHGPGPFYEDGDPPPTCCCSCCSSDKVIRAAAEVARVITSPRVRSVPADKSGVETR